MLAHKPDIGFRKASQDLELSESLLHQWVELSAIEALAFRGHGVRTEHDAKIAALKRDILKMRRNSS